jgi:hypothetical protein
MNHNLEHKDGEFQGDLSGSSLRCQCFQTSSNIAVVVTAYLFTPLHAVAS